MCFTASDHEEYSFDWEPITKSCWYIIVGHTFHIFHSAAVTYMADRFLLQWDYKIVKHKMIVECGKE